MSERVLIKNLGEYKGKTVSISGWVDVRRDHGKLIFLVARDRSGAVQTVVSAKNESAFTVAETLRSQWVVEMSGKVKERPENMKKDEPNGNIEFAVESIEVLSQADELPFDLDAELNIDTHLDHLPITLRSKKGRDMLAVQAIIADVFRNTLREENFTEFQAPALVGADAEGGATAFKVQYYKDSEAFLATSPQLYKQIMIGVLERVFTTPKVFRGEKHATSRHLAEYSSLDFEMGFIRDHTDVMAILEKVVHNTVKTLKERHAHVFADFGTEPPHLPEKIPSITLREAQKTLGVSEEPDLEPEHERQICEWTKKEHGSDFLFITHYPVEKRPFYTYEDESDKGYTKSFDLLFRGLEITTGGQRIHDYNTLVGNIKKWGLKPELFSFYLEAFKYGLPPHGGCATGLERFTARLLELPNVKWATLFPRDMTRIDVRLSEE